MKKLLKKIVPKRMHRRIRLLLHKGNKYTCPFCGYSSKDLLALGHDVPVLTEKQVVGGRKRFGKCYKCGSSDRERLMYIYLKEEIKLFDTGKKKSILHIAPEKNLTNALLRSGFEDYVCGDLFTPGYRYPAHVKDINILNIPYSDNTFDLIICNHVLEHIPDDLRAMRELSRVLKPGGQAILQVPISKNSPTTFEDFSITEPEKREQVFGQFDHVRIYGQDYVQRLAKSGFRVNRVNISERYKKYGVNSEEDIFVCEK